MRLADIQYKKLVLVCVNEREDGRDCCTQKLSKDLHQKLKAAVKAFDSNIRVSQTGCLGNCLSGASIAIMPNNIYLGEVTEADIPQILEILKT